MKRVLSFDDVLISPRFSTIKSRANCDTTTTLGNIALNLPILSSNMDSVTGPNMARAMKEAGGLGALHRFCTIEENVAMYKESPPETFVSVGLGEKEIERVRALLEAGAANIILDVAHGANSNVVKQYQQIRRYAGHDAHVMVGNFSNAGEIADFINALKGSQSPSSIKVGIGGGSMCTTRIVTGCGIPTLQSILDINKAFSIPIIADGGIKNSGDIAKALAAGASAVMVGNLLAGTDESPGERVTESGYPYPFGVQSLFVERGENIEIAYLEGCVNLVGDKNELPSFKKYRGSASKESYEVQGKIASHRSPEGETTLVPYKGPVKPILEQLKAGLQSAMSYVGAGTMAEFYENSELVEITNSGMNESKAHGKK